MQTARVLLSAILGLLLGFTVSVQGQQRTVISHGASLPATCAVGDLFFLTSGTIALHQCAVTNTWTTVIGVPARDPSYAGVAVIDFSGIQLDYTGTGTYDGMVIQTQATDTTGAYLTNLELKARTPANANAHDYVSALYGAGVHGGTGILAYLAGFEGYAGNTGGGTATEAYGVTGNLTNAGGSVTVLGVGVLGRLFAASGSITTGNAFRAAAPVGTITTNYGLFIADQSGPATSYALYYDAPSSKTFSVNAAGDLLATGGVQFAAVNTAAPAGADCDAAAETGKYYFDSTNDLLYICSGASGWRKIATASP